MIGLIHLLFQKLFKFFFQEVIQKATPKNTIVGDKEKFFKNFKFYDINLSYAFNLVLFCVKFYMINIKTNFFLNDSFLYKFNCIG